MTLDRPGVTFLVGSTSPSTRRPNLLKVVSNGPLGLALVPPKSWCPNPY